MKKIKSFEEGLQVTGRPIVDFANVPEDHRSYFENQYKAVVITEAINNGWVADWNDPNQKKWIPVFYMSPSGFGLFALPLSRLRLRVTPRAFALKRKRQQIMRVKRLQIFLKELL